MSRINTNVASLQTLHQLSANQTDLALHLQRLSTGLRINSASDDPAGLIGSESLRSEIAGINQAINNSQRAGNVIETAEGALNEVSALLNELEGLTNQSANTGGLSPAEIRANQLQADAILNSINRISNTTQFNGIHLLNGSLDYLTSGVSSANISGLTVNAAKISDNGTVGLTVQVTSSAKVGEITYAASGISAAPRLLKSPGTWGTSSFPLPEVRTTARLHLRSIKYKAPQASVRRCKPTGN